MAVFSASMAPTLSRNPRRGLSAHSGAGGLVRCGVPFLVLLNSFWSTSTWILGSHLGRGSVDLGSDVCQPSRRPSGRASARHACPSLCVVCDCVSLHIGT